MLFNLISNQKNKVLIPATHSIDDFTFECGYRIIDQVEMIDTTTTMKDYYEWKTDMDDKQYQNPWNNRD